MSWNSILFRFGILFVFPFISSCGGGGGSGGTPSAEILYVLTEASASPNAGSIYYFALNPGTGSFYSNSAETISTGGNVPISLKADPSNSNYVYVLNNNNPTSGTANGTVAGFSAASYGHTMGSISSRATGPNPVNMAIDPGGNYLLVADHGNGTSSCISGSTCGDVKAYQINSGTLSSPTTWTSTSCYDPYRVVFAPNATGKSSDTFFVACSSPELIGSTNPGITLFSCSNFSAISCTQITSATNTSSYALLNFTFNPSGTEAIGPEVGLTGPAGYLLTCSFSSTLTCSSPIEISINWVPSGNIAFHGSGSSEKVYVGNYYPSSSSGFTLGTYFGSCTVLSCSSTTMSATYQFTTTSTIYDGPIYLSVQGSTLYIATTVTPVGGSYSASGTTGGTTIPTTGYIFSCSLPLASSTPCNTPVSTNYWPLSMTMDSSGNYMFVPTLAGYVDVFSGVSSGTLSLSSAVYIGQTPVSVIVQ